MSLVTLLGVAISLSFAYLLLSSAASTVNELIVAVLKSRAKGLKSSIEALVGAGNGPNGALHSELARLVYGHALIAGTSETRRPAYVPSRNFTLALLDTLIGNNQATSLTAMQETIAKMPDGPVRQALGTLLDEAGGDMAAFKLSVDHWFDDAMDRLGGAYKRNAQATLLAIGFVLAALLNVDTVRIVNVLMHDTTRLEATVRAATAFATSHADAATPTSGGETAATVADPAEEISALRKKALDEIATLQSTPLPVGWDDCGAACDGRSVTPQNLFAGKLSPLSALVGWILTAIAVSFGAPFWFDLLNRFINLRSSGPKPPTGGEGTKTAEG
ncbi:hypothetical protein SAMN02745157_2663 [Kaistia soli DSM 19436]|uniref:Uncharacterized protein n=1 Tax=Kaistia soli DSM 19436 TaxID=1122133 RepID=A0A1M5DEX5_9HYPH|nr:hypothetical protein [Kaistia soli]SHF65603.1 hypothetical protein SAMN02745157_2663 [Kaistia soli DSM 19436]